MGASTQGAPSPWLAAFWLPLRAMALQERTNEASEGHDRDPPGGDCGCWSAVQEGGSPWLMPLPGCVCRRRALQGRINEAIEVHDVTNKEEAKAARRATLEDGPPLVPIQRAKSITSNQGEGGCWQPGRV